MSIDVFNEQVVSLSDAAKHLPKVKRGKNPHPSSLWRWTVKGQKAPDGRIVRLETIKVGGTTCTSLEALQRYFERLTGDIQIETPPTITERHRLRHEERIERELDAIGIGTSR